MTGPFIKLNCRTGIGVAALLALAYFCLMSDLPWHPAIPITVWAWERPEHLEFLPPETTVAYLTQTIYLRGDRLVTRLRYQPLTLPPKARLIAVFRIETTKAEPPTLSNSQMTRLAEQITAFAYTHPNEGVQTDFDATLSERPFYHALLKQLHEKLPKTVSLSMTALASWCLSDYYWLADLPVVEAVPMVFRMGADTAQVTQYLKRGKDFQLPICSHSVGVAVDEPIRQILFRSVSSHGTMAGRTLYLFNPHPWQLSEWQKIQAELNHAS